MKDSRDEFLDQLREAGLVVLVIAGLAGLYVVTHIESCHVQILSTPAETRP